MSFEFGHRYVNCFSCKHISVITLFSKWNTITIAKTKQNILLRIHNKIYLLLDLSIVEFKLKFFLDETRLDRSRNKILFTYFYPRFFRASYSFCIVLPNFFLEMRESYSETTPRKSVLAKKNIPPIRIIHSSHILLFLANIANNATTFVKIKEIKRTWD